MNKTPGGERDWLKLELSNNCVFISTVNKNQKD